MKLNRSIERYARLSPEAVAGGSQAQSLFFIKDACADIATLSAALESKDTLIAELVEALEAAEELYQIGLLNAEPELIERVKDVRRAALSKAKAGA